MIYEIGKYDEQNIPSWRVLSAGANLQGGDGRSHIGSGFAWMANADSQDSDQFPTLPYKICPSLSEFTRKIVLLPDESAV